jgi:predicted MFS family arabinose efflux permease
MLGGLINHQYGWGVTTLALGATTAVAAIPGLWLSGPSSEKVHSADALEEREPLLESSSVQSSSNITTDNQIESKS